MTLSAAAKRAPKVVPERHFIQLFVELKKSEKHKSEGSGVIPR